MRLEARDVIVELHGNPSMAKSGSPSRIVRQIRASPFPFELAFVFRFCALLFSDVTGACLERAGVSGRRIRSMSGSNGCTYRSADSERILRKLKTRFFSLDDGFQSFVKSTVQNSFTSNGWTWRPGREVRCLGPAWFRCAANSFVLSCCDGY